MARVPEEETHPFATEHFLETLGFFLDTWDFSWADCASTSTMPRAQNRTAEGSQLSSKDLFTCEET